MAYSQYEALAPDHPHRIKYGTGYRIPPPNVNGVTSYQIPPASYQIPPASHQIPPSSYIIDQPVPVADQTHESYIPTQPSAPSMSYNLPSNSGQPGSSFPPTGQASYPSPGAPQYKDDPPPPYSSVVAKVNTPTTYLYVSGEHKVPGVMMAQQQTPGSMAPQQPQVVVVQQPIVTVTNQKQSAPYLLRGARFDSGCRCPGTCFSFLVAMGIIIFISELITSTSSGFSSTSFLIFAGGGVLLVSGLCLCHTAYSQYEALPPNHPHRIKYGTGYRLPSPNVNGVTSYQIPPASYQIPPASHQIPPSSYIIDQPVPVADQTHESYIPTQPSAPSMSYNLPSNSGQPGSSFPPTGQASYPSPGAPQYKDDPPPPYSSVVARE
ncbi:hypothetical protein Pcinc_032311 [Petrolisthes cinctipes]|uniref:Uncharacterized protein n=1 Tax=Petrolisthes cinctipes TaxID=88211 RepID=A0AAE1EUD4_PETCI|nr:hypothetical protein Pcinc_032311 [Petrolisthes cinctipes]